MAKHSPKPAGEPVPETVAAPAVNEVAQDPATEGVAEMHFTDTTSDPAAALPVSKPAGFQWAIIYDLYHADGRRLGEKEVHVTAPTEEEAFHLALVALEGIRIEDEPVRWRFTGRFRKVAA